MNIYELINEMESQRNYCLKNLWLSFDQSNRDKLEETYDLEVFDLLKKVYEVSIIYISDQRDSNIKMDYRKIGGEAITSFADDELKILENLDWARLSHNFQAYIYDVIWLCNKKYEAAKVAFEAYFALYREWFDEEEWVECIDYINRAVELAAKTGNYGRKECFLREAYNDVVRLNGNDSLFLSISLIELIIDQNYECDFEKLIPFMDRLIAKNKCRIGKEYVVEQAFYTKANLYKKIRNTVAENEAYVKYADLLMKKADKLITEGEREQSAGNQNWVIAEANVKKAIELYQNHSANKKAVNAQKHLIKIQKDSIAYMPVYKFKYYVPEEYKQFVAEYENHNVQELIWDVIFIFEFQNKNELHKKIIRKPLSFKSIFPTQTLGREGQSEFVNSGLQADDENSVLLHMYREAREDELIIGWLYGGWFIQQFKKLGLQESDLDMVFVNNPIIPKGQEKDVQRGVYYGLIGRMSDALDKLAPKMENIIRNVAEMCGDLVLYYDYRKGIQQKRVLGQIFEGEKLKECFDENILFTFDGLLQQKAGSNIRNKIGHGLMTEEECFAGDCIYFVMIVLKFCALYCENFKKEFSKRTLAV